MESDLNQQSSIINLLLKNFVKSQIV